MRGDRKRETMTTNVHNLKRNETIPRRHVEAILAAAVAWVVLAMGGILNGGLRQALLAPWLGERVARIMSIALLVAIILAVSVAFVRTRWSPRSSAGLFLVGIAWALGSALFEFGLGRLVFDMPWSELFAAYNLLAGQYWILAPVSMAIGPALARRWLRGLP